MWFFLIKICWTQFGSSSVALVLNRRSRPTDTKKDNDQYISFLILDSLSLSDSLENFGINGGFFTDQVPVSVTEKTSYRKISWSIKAAILVVENDRTALKFDRHINNSFAEVPI